MPKNKWPTFGSAISKQKKCSEKVNKGIREICYMKYFLNNYIYYLNF